MSNIRDKIDRLTAIALHRMTDEQLQAIAGANPPDLSSLTDAELETLLAGCPCPELAARIEGLTNGHD